MLKTNQPLFLALLTMFVCLMTTSNIVLASQKTKHSPYEQAPPFTLTTLDGKSFSLAEFSGKKPVFLFFWATWCPICKKEIPRIKALHANFGNDIEILAINTGFNDSIENTHHYQTRHNIPYAIAFDLHSEISKRYGVYGTPTQIVIDIDGKIRYQGHHFPPGLGGFVKQLSRSQTNN